MTASPSTSASSSSTTSASSSRSITFRYDGLQHLLHCGISLPAIQHSLDGLQWDIVHIALNKLLSVEFPWCVGFSKLYRIAVLDSVLHVGLHLPELCVGVVDNDWAHRSLHRSLDTSLVPLMCTSQPSGVELVEARFTVDEVVV